jgi:hypothetical protein
MVKVDRQAASPGSSKLIKGTGGVEKRISRGELLSKGDFRMAAAYFVEGGIGEIG